MKALIASLVMFAASVSMANTVVSADIAFNNGDGFGVTMANIQDVCWKDGMFYLDSTSVNICSGSEANEECEWVTLTDLYAPTSFEAAVYECSGSDANEECAWTTKTFNQPRTQNVPVYEVETEAGDTQWTFVGRQSYTVPACGGAMPPVDAN
jgi:hypothetical protein